MAIVVVPSFGADPVTITGPTLDAKVDGLATDYNGNIDNSNIVSSAAIANSKLNLASVSQNVTLAGTNVLSGASTISGALTVSGVTTMSSKILKLAKGADVASVAGAITLGDDGNYFDITGTNAITSITAKTAGTVVVLQFDSTASLVDGSNLKLAGNFTGAAESQIMLVSDGTNWFEISRTPETTFTPSVSNALAGSVINIVNTQTGAVATGTTTIPDDDTIPQNTEGDEYMTLAITPNNTNNKLKIDVVFQYEISAGVAGAIAIFQDSTAGALAAQYFDAATNIAGVICFTHYMTAGTTSATTFKVRAGGGSGTLTFNGNAGARKLGGVLASSITITEIKV